MMQGDELRQLRKKAGMSQGELASELGLSQGYIGEMERGEKQIEKRTELALRYIVAERGDRLPSLDLLFEEGDKALGMPRYLEDDDDDLVEGLIGWLDRLQAGWKLNNGGDFGAAILKEARNRAEGLCAVLGRAHVRLEVADDFEKLRTAWQLVRPSRGSADTLKAMYLGASTETSPDVIVPPAVAAATERALARRREKQLEASRTG